MTFPMAKTHSSQLTFIAQAEIQVQKAFPKKKKIKKNINDVPNGKKSSPAYLHRPNRNPGSGSVPKRKEAKVVLVRLLNQKKITILTYFSHFRLKSRCP